MLTAYRGMQITYDEVGNPLSYYNGTFYDFTWVQGRRLESVLKGGTTTSYTYNADGIRTSKTTGTLTKEYILNGTQILAELWSDGTTIIYVYDAEGSAVGMLYRNNTYASGKFDAYFYERNLMGDIIAVYSVDGTKLISYVYDAWGKVTTTYHNGGANTGAANNPFKYRGYYHDSETSFYYLNSRYYDPAICRFINQDSALYHSMLGYNMFAYCYNNPVNYVDYTGEIAISATFCAFGLVVLAAPVIYEFSDALVTTTYKAGKAFGNWLDDKTNNKENSHTAPPQNVPEATEKPNDDTTPTVPNVEYPGDDPTVAPDGYEWKGPDKQGGKRGGYKNKNPNSRDSWHPDLNHPDGVKPHWDYNDVFKNKWRVFPDGIEFVP